MCILAMCSRVNLRGDVVRSSINIYNSGCMLAMKDMPDNAYDLAIVDPPYGIGAVILNKNTCLLVCVVVRYKKLRRKNGNKDKVSKTRM